MNVASLELCKELYELSGWEAPTLYFNGMGGWRYDGDENDGEVLHDPDEAGNWCPAYPLGYLLRKLQGTGVRLLEESNNWKAYSEKSSKDFTEKSPEDAACKLAIELIKQGISKAKEEHHG